MPTTDSIIIKDYLQVITNGKGEQVPSHSLGCSRYGCSEWPAHEPSTTQYMSFGIQVLRESVVENTLAVVFGEEATVSNHIGNWAQFVVDTFEHVSKNAGEPLFEVFTLGRLRELSKTMSGLPSINSTGLSGNPNYHGYTIPKINAGDDFVVGLTTNARAIRKYSGAQYPNEKGVLQNTNQMCRKVQIGHTMYRLMWSEGWSIPIMAMKLKQMSEERKSGLTNLQCLWLAYKFRLTLSRTYNSYGDIFTTNSGYLTDECLIKRFKTSSLNTSVMSNFAEEQNPMAAELGLSKGQMQDAKITANLFGDKLPSSLTNSAPGVMALMKGLDDAVFDRIVKFIYSCDIGLNNKYTKVKFKFSKALFKSTAIGVRYEGILKPESKLNRVLFKDEENSVLSVLRESKFIVLL